MWRKKKDPLLELLGYDSELDFATADGVVMDTIHAIISGNLEVILEVCQLETLKKEDLAGVSGIIKGHATMYVKKFFSRSTFHVVDVEEDADETIAAVHLKGETVSAAELVAKTMDLLARNEQTLQLRKGSIDLRKMRQVMALVDGAIQDLPVRSVSGVVNMEKLNGKWQMKHRDELANVMILASPIALEKQLVEKYGFLFGA